MTDSYNATHWLIRNDKEHEAVAYMYNRKEPMILFGLAGIVNQLHNKEVYIWDIEHAAEDAKSNGFEFNVDLWNHLTRKYQGFPFRAVTVEQVPEFALYPAGCPLAKISSNTAPELVTYFEGALTKCFFPSMVLTKLWKYKEAGIQNLHNFSYRSCRTEEESYWVALAFSMLYDGTDNFNINYLKRAVKETVENRDLHYMLAPYEGMISNLNPKTIIALNHREVQSWKNEQEMIENVIPKAKNKSLAMPIDTYDYERFIIKYAGYAIRLAAENNCNLHFRIDSGDHIEQAKYILNQIITYKERNMLVNKPMPSFGIIIGDHMDLPQILIILDKLQEWTQERKVEMNLNDYVYFGLGGSLLEGISRDQVGMVTKLGWTDYVGNTMKTAKGKESLLGHLGIKQKGDEYRVYFDSTDFYYKGEQESWRNYEAMKTGFSNALLPKQLTITQEVKNAQQVFIKKNCS